MLDDLNKAPKTLVETTCHDYGLKYVMDTYNKTYDPKLKYLKLTQVPLSVQIQQEPKQIGESFMCISKTNWEKLQLDPVLSYNNDVAIRDLTVIKGIDFEWLNDDMIIYHMLGLDDEGINFERKDKANFTVLIDILSRHPELSHWGLFRFQKENIPYLWNLDSKKIYDEYIKGKMNLYNQEDFWDFIYKENN